MVCPETQSDNRNTTYDTVIQWLYPQIIKPLNISTVAAATTQQAQGTENLETAYFDKLSNRQPLKQRSEKREA